MKTSQLTGAALDWAVAKCEGWIDDCNGWLYQATLSEVENGHYKPSTDWSQSGPIIERENIGLTAYHRAEGMAWRAVSFDDKNKAYGPTILVAAMRCYLASKLGNNVEIPDELK